MKQEYLMLKLKEEQLSQKTKSLIIKAITENNGRITFRKGQDEYPITKILSGYSISITDVYLDENGRICINGIDNDITGTSTELTIEPDHYSDILFFIAYVLGWKRNPQETQVARDAINSNIMEMACQLAEKEMVNGYGKLPEYFMNGNGAYTDFYQDVFNLLYDKYYNRIAALADFELR